jgi:glycosyltransferase involved in cell wall biosynthesis
MRIGIVYETTFPEFKGGVERWFLQLAEGLSKQSINVQYFNTSGKTISSQSVQYISLKNNTNSFHKTGQRSIRNTLSFAISVFKGLKKTEVDILYLSSFPFFHIWASKIVQKIFRKRYKIYVEWFELPKAKFWINEFGFPIGITGYLIQQNSVRQSDVNVAYLESTAHELRQLQTQHQITLRLPGICLEKFVHQNSTFNRDTIDICQIGRLTKDKQPLLSLSAIKILRDTGWAGTFHLIGSGPLEKEVSKYVIQNEMTSYVTVHVDVSDALKEMVLLSSAVLLHPSKREGFGLAIVEAAALGVPTILIRNPNNKSTELGVNPSLIAESEDPQELATLLKSVLKDRSKYVKECQRWNIDRRRKMLATDSINELAAHFENLLSAKEN